MVSGEDLAKLEVGGCEDVDVSEVRGSGLLRGAAAVPGPRLAPRLPPVRGVRQGSQPRHTRGGEAEHVVYSPSVSIVSINLYLKIYICTLNTVFFTVSWHQRQSVFTPAHEEISSFGPLIFCGVINEDVSQMLIIRLPPCLYGSPI